MVKVALLPAISASFGPISDGEVCWPNINESGTYCSNQREKLLSFAIPTPLVMDLRVPREDANRAEISEAPSFNYTRLRA